MIFAIFAAVYAVALGWLLWVAHKNRKWYALAKGVCSMLFLLRGALPGFWGQVPFPALYGLLMAGLLLCAFGDIFLGVANSTAGKVSKKPFLAGAISFSAAHVLFCAVLYWLQGFAWQDVVLPAALLCLLYMLEKRKLVRLKKMRPLAYVYTFLVSLMAGKAVMLLWAAPGQGSVFLSVGAGLFFVSDVILLFLYFGTRRKLDLRAANLITYYAGVYLMAASMSYF